MEITKLTQPDISLRMDVLNTELLQILSYYFTVVVQQMGTNEIRIDLYSNRDGRNNTDHRDS